MNAETALKPLRIAVFAPDDYFPPAGGAEVAMGSIMKGLPEIHFDLYSSHVGEARPKVEVDGNVTLYRQTLGPPKFQKFVGVSFLAPIFAAFRPKYDVCWGMMATYGGMGASFFHFLTGTPFVLTLQEGDPLDEIERRTKPYRFLFKRIFSTANSLQPISNFLRDWGFRMGFHGKISDVIPNGVDTARFEIPITPEARIELRKLWNIPDDGIVLITTSRLVKKNGVGDVIEALPSMPSNVIFVVYGVGELDAQLKARATKLGVNDRIRWMGHVAYEKVPDVIKAADVFIRPSLTEGLGNSFIEAMAAGLPTIATPVGGIPDFLTDGVTGFMCQPNDPASIAAAMQRVLSLSDEERSRILKQARDTVRDRYSWTRVIADMRTLFNETAKLK